MGMGCGGDTPGRLFRRHIKEMRKYAVELGGESPASIRVSQCADECEAALDRLTGQYFNKPGEQQPL